MTAVLSGDEELDRFFKTLTPTLQRGALRKGVRAGGSVLIKNIRANLDLMLSNRSASRRGLKRFARRTGKATSLKKAMGQRAWSKPEKGVIGTVVGGRWPEGAHAHLVELGHRVVSHGKDTGVRTRPVPFQRNAERTSRSAIANAQAKKLREAISKLRAK